MTQPAAVRQLGRFRILGELGRGAMGVVYEAHDPALDRTVALKTIVLTGDAAERAGYEARFLQEARAAGKLSHPAIITVFDVGREGDLAWMAMERLAGTDLRQQMAAVRPPPRAALGIAAQVAEGLGYAHAHGVIHRDIKPANIMLLRGGRAKIMDFGIARLQVSEVKTQTGVLLGTPKYMSPEQLSGLKVDHRCDIFSLGAVLYEMLTGRTPFGGADVSQLMHAIAHAPHVAPSRVVPGLPAVLDLVLDRALAKDPAARYAGADELAADLRSALDELPALPRPRPAAAPAGATTDELADTEQLTAALVPAGERTMVAPGPDGARFCALSRRFDSSKALRRIASTGGRDRTRLGLAPRGPGAIGLVLRDPDLRLAAAVLAGGLVAALALVLL
jgi:eukaryotic-like serine/threonine-protein kinase